MIPLTAFTNYKISTLKAEDIDICPMEDDFCTYKTLSVDINRYKIKSQGKHRVFVHADDFKKDFFFSLAFYMVMKGNSTDDNGYLLPEMASSVRNEKTGNIKSEVSGMFTAMFDSMTKVVNDYLTRE